MVKVVWITGKRAGWETEYREPIAEIFIRRGLVRALEAPEPEASLSPAASQEPQPEEKESPALAPTAGAPSAPKGQGASRSRRARG